MKTNLMTANFMFLMFLCLNANAAPGLAVQFSSPALFNAATAAPQSIDREPGYVPAPNCCGGESGGYNAEVPAETLTVRVILSVKDGNSDLLCSKREDLYLDITRRET